ncbi:sodium:calcium antiporter [Chloroflexota bacterium]
MVWIEFILCLLLIFFSGRKVASYGDIIAERTGLGGAWIGLVLLALVTSLPELFTGVSAITLAKSPDLTIGDLFGANSFNLLNLALLDIASRNGSLLAVVTSTHRLTVRFSLALVFTAAAAIFLSNYFPTPGIAWIGWSTPVIVGLYLFSIRYIFVRERGKATPQIADRYSAELDLKVIYRNFALASVVIIGAGIWLAILGKEIATVTGWEESFVGSLLIAFTTTLPEITVSFTALRLGAINLAFANMIGSNLFNMTIIPIDDLIYNQGPVLAAVSSSHLVIALTVMAMTGILIAGLRYRPKRFFRLSWYNCATIVVFLLGTYFHFNLG